MEARVFHSQSHEQADDVQLSEDTLEQKIPER